MKKILLIIILLVTLSGCTMIDKNNYEYNEITTEIINRRRNTTNMTALGYKYYLPKGVVLTYNKDFNQIFYSSNTTMYLYVDIVSYYHKVDVKYKNDLDNTYYQNIVNNNSNKMGYIKIKEGNSKIYLEIVYNYAKIEMYTRKSELTSNVINSLIILSSIEYNDAVIKKLNNQNYFSSNTKTYSLKKPEGDVSNFLEYIEEYSNYNEKAELPDDKSINKEIDE